MSSLSRPPVASAIILDQPFHLPPGKKINTEYPAGAYKPVGQDSDGTYYQSEQPPRLHDFTPMFDKDVSGGFYLRDDGTEGLHVWGRNGEIVGHGPLVRNGRGVAPPYRVIK